MIRYRIDNVFFDDIEQQDINLTYGGDGIDANISNVRFFLDAKDLINTIVNNLDVFRRIPFEIYHNNDIIYSGYLSFRELHNLADKCEYIEMSHVKEGIRSLQDIADSITVLGSNIQYIQVPYQLSSIPDKQAIAIALTGVFLTTYILQEQLTQLIEYITLTISNPFTVNAVLMLALRVGYVALLLVALVKYIIDLIKALIPDVNYCNAINIANALNVMLSRAGYALSSDFLFSSPYNNLVIILSRDNDGNITDNTTLRDLLDLVKRLFNVDIRVNNTTVIINKSRTYSTPTIAIDNYNLIDRSIDLSECPASILLRFKYDASDKNTVTNGVGNSVQAIWARHGDAIVNEIPLTRAKRKNELTSVERILKTVLSVVDTVVNAMVNAVNGAIDAINTVIRTFNKVIGALRKVGIRINVNLQEVPKLQRVSLSATISDRIGNLLTEADTWGLNKLALLDSNKISQDNASVVNAEHLFNNFYSERFVYEIVSIKISACYDTLRQLITENYFTLQGYTYKVIEVNYNLNSTIMSIKGKRILANDIPYNNLIIN